MANTNASAVQELLGDAYDATYAVTNYITVANLLVDRHCTNDDLTANELEAIERYLAAHFYCITHRRATQERAGDVGENKQHIEDLGLDATEYGQMAKRLDWTGALASLDNAAKKGLRRSVNISWAGKENSETDEYELLGL